MPNAPRPPRETLPHTRVDATDGWTMFPLAAYAEISLAIRNGNDYEGENVYGERITIMSAFVTTVQERTAEGLAHRAESKDPTPTPTDDA